VSPGRKPTIDAKYLLSIALQVLFEACQAYLVVRFAPPSSVNRHKPLAQSCGAYRTSLATPNQGDIACTITHASVRPTGAAAGHARPRL